MNGCGRVVVVLFAIQNDSRISHDYTGADTVRIMLPLGETAELIHLLDGRSRIDVTFDHAGARVLA